MVVTGSECVNVLTGAERGYLGSALRDSLVGLCVDYGDVMTQNHKIDRLDNMLHFAGPSDIYDFKDTENVINTIVTGTMNTLNYTKKHNGKYIFASTVGVKDPTNVYCYSKLLMEEYIRSVYNNYIILRIPRVYSGCRNKGLMRQIRDETIPAKDMDNVIEFITLQDFINQTIPVLDERNITHEYNITQKMSIREIKEWIEK